VANRAYLHIFLSFLRVNIRTKGILKYNGKFLEGISSDQKGGVGTPLNGQRFRSERFGYVKKLPWFRNFWEAPRSEGLKTLPENWGRDCDSVGELGLCKSIECSPRCYQFMLSFILCPELLIGLASNGPGGNFE
jgi:hypothetical protein